MSFPASSQSGSQAYHEELKANEKMRQMLKSQIDSKKHLVEKEVDAIDLEEGKSSGGEAKIHAQQHRPPSFEKKASEQSKIGMQSSATNSETQPQFLQTMNGILSPQFNSEQLDDKSSGENKAKIASGSSPYTKGSLDQESKKAESLEAGEDAKEHKTETRPYKKPFPIKEVDEEEKEFEEAAALVQLNKVNSSQSHK